MEIAVVGGRLQYFLHIPDSGDQRQVKQRPKRKRSLIVSEKSLDHLQVAEAASRWVVHQAGNQAEPGVNKRVLPRPQWGREGDPATLVTPPKKPHLPTPTHSPRGMKSPHVPESSPRDPGSTPPNRMGHRSGTPRNVRPRSSVLPEK